MLLFVFKLSLGIILLLIAPRIYLYSYFEEGKSYEGKNVTIYVCGLFFFLNCFVSLAVKELCRLESKTISRNIENQQDHLRGQIPAQNNSKPVCPTTKKVGTGESTCKINQKYVGRKILTLQ